MDAETLVARIRALDGSKVARREAAVLIPLILDDGNPQILLEVRAQTLAVQPGEVCLPGGAIEGDESPRDAAVRETCEELCVDEGQIEVLASLGPQPGPGGRALHVFVGVLSGYEGTFSPDEVERTFTVGLDWLLRTEPDVHEVTMTPTFASGFPWHLVPGGEAYSWRRQVSAVPFYPDTDPVIWGATARVLLRFAKLIGA